MLTQAGLELKIKLLVKKYISLSSELRALAARIFCKRKVIVISEKGISSIPVSSKSQGMVVMVALLILLWISYSTGKYVTHENVLSQKDREIWSTNITNNELQYQMADLHRNLADLNRYFENIRQLDAVSQVSRISGHHDDGGDIQVSGVAKDEVIDEKNNTTDVQQILSNIRSKVISRITNLENIVQKTGLDIKKIAENNPQLRNALLNAPSLHSEVSGSEKGGRGGPFIPLDEAGSMFNQEEFEAEVGYLMQLEKVVSVMPLAAPLKKYHVSSSFGKRVDPIRGRIAMHSGVDIAGAFKSKVYSTAPGIVKRAGNASAYGRLIEIDHGSGISTYYAHLNRILVRSGEKVKRGQLIGLQGNSGRSTGTHLHYEVRLNNRPVNPSNFLEAGKYVF